jgi:hypothetical protein
MKLALARVVHPRSRIQKQLAQTAIKRYNKSMERNKTYSVMDGFIKGMGSITLFPDLPDPEPETSPWQGVFDAFEAANRNLVDAIYEFKNAQGLA